MRALALLAAFALAASPALAQDDPRLASLDPQARSAIAAAIDSARTNGLPVEPLVDKALEGASKGAAADRIVLAVRNLALDLAAARRALGAGASDAELVAGVSALRAGAASDVLSRLKAARGEQSALLPLAVLSDLVAQGTPVDRAAEAVLSLAQRGATEAQYRELPAAAATARERGRAASPVPAGGRQNASPSPTGTGASGGTAGGNPPVSTPPVTTGNPPRSGTPAANTPAGHTPGGQTPAAQPPARTPAANAPRTTPPRGRPVTTPERSRSSGHP